MKTFRFPVVGWLFLTILAVESLAGAAQAEHEALAEITVRTYNYAEAPPGVIQPALEQAGRLFRHAGVTVRWAPCFPATPDAAPCPPGAGSDVLELRIIRGFPSRRIRLHPSTCGYALRSAEGRPGSMATVYFGCVEKTAARAKLSARVVLAHAIAHELGHLLLPDAGHAPQGLMQARASADYWRRAAQGALRFSEEQARQMRAMARARRTEARAVAASSSRP